MSRIKILWADDEIEMLRPHIIFLQEKGYDVDAVVSGDEAIEMISENYYDIVFLDEQMPGMSGIETLEHIKKKNATLPVVMITKSEEESIMEDAIGSNIADYLIKPVKPSQILLSLKRNLENRKLAGEKATVAYQQQFRELGIRITDRLDYIEWGEVYRDLTRYEFDLDKSDDKGMAEILNIQKQEANNAFAKYYGRNYKDWLNGNSDSKPTLSHTLVKDYIFPLLDNGKQVFMLLIDNLRFDQWTIIKPLIEQYFRVDNESLYYSIIPTTTQYARNAIFAGMMPNEIRNKYRNYWVDEHEEGTKNKFEQELLKEQFKRFGRTTSISYNKILNLNAGRKLFENISNLMNTEFNVIVYNFVDMLSHARTEMEIIRELADNEASYRSLMFSWFEHSSLFDIIKYLASKNVSLMITTDHGSIKVTDPIKVVGDKNVNTNLRYKFGKSLAFKDKDVFEIANPEEYYLPKINISTRWIFSRGADFFAYPNNFNYYSNYYKNTFQHGGMSMEEILIPAITLSSK
ncbi:MAG: PglZ domain-containing protein [Bacteroidales bacterium]|jgi:DNA-binding response OmpR family regulator|nr:PglZ domain-containing protein [Bacteroidales bacterium]MDG1901898.1 PglZ domain-containing protein [Bacteroidales bacterium]MDG2081043.1 PglZ domain-containing protein [Bacteroidales bacterium]|tara:strand:+ start:5475 stop:7028 length:1554 start_codon:yes stop_codon:yes gene_type:complete